MVPQHDASTALHFSSSDWAWFQSLSQILPRVIHFEFFSPRVLVERFKWFSLQIKFKLIISEFYGDFFAGNFFFFLLNLPEDPAAASACIRVDGTAARWTFRLSAAERHHRLWCNTSVLTEISGRVGLHSSKRGQMWASGSGRMSGRSFAAGRPSSCSYFYITVREREGEGKVFLLLTFTGPSGVY